MATEVIAYVAVSLDGFIAEEDGTVTFLNEFGSPDYDFHGFIATIGGVVMGSTTYEQIVGRTWPYGDIPGLILTTRDLPRVDGGDLAFSEGDTSDSIRAYASTIAERVWVVGGGEVITDGVNGGAIDTLELYVMPVALGSGIPLFARRVERPLTLTDSHVYANGVVKLVYGVGEA